MRRPMTCETALERILVADPEELSGEVSSPLAEHLGECARCRGLADEVLKGQAALAAFLRAEGPRTTVEEILPETRRGEEAPDREAGRRPWRGWAWGALPLAAAAVVAGLLLMDGAPGPAVVTPTETGPAEAVRRQPVSERAPGERGGVSASLPRPPRVAVPRARGVTIMRTSNPKVSVVWIQAESD